MNSATKKFDLCSTKVGELVNLVDVKGTNTAVVQHALLHNDQGPAMNDRALAAGTFLILTLQAF